MGTFRYELGAQIGEGGSAEVFAGVLHGTDGFRRDVAIKRLRAPVEASAYQQFRREALICAGLTHPNIVSVFDFRHDPDDRLCIVMERVHGADLAALLLVEQRLPFPLVEYIVSCMLRGLSHAHSRHIVHRDISPGNVLISWEGEVKLSDFGIARVIEGNEAFPDASIRGTIGYMSPETATGDPDPRSDLFSVGAILYRLLTGKSPFRARTVAGSLVRVLGEDPVPPRELRPEVPGELSAVVMRLLDKRKEDRYQCAEEALDALSFPRHGAEDLAALLAARRHEMENALFVVDGTDSETTPLELVTLAQAMVESLRGRGHTVQAVPGTLAPAMPEEIEEYEEDVLLAPPGEARPEAKIDDSPDVPARQRSRLYMALAAIAGAIVLGVIAQRAWQEPPRHTTPPGDASRAQAPQRVPQEPPAGAETDPQDMAERGPAPAPRRAAPRPRRSANTHTAAAQVSEPARQPAPPAPSRSASHRPVAADVHMPEQVEYAIPIGADLPGAIAIEKGEKRKKRKKGEK
jgi:hypothetical protein